MDFASKDRSKKNNYYECNKHSIHADVVKVLNEKFALDFLDQQNGLVAIEMTFNRSAAGRQIAGGFLNYFQELGYVASLKDGFLLAADVPERVADELEDMLTAPDALPFKGKSQILKFEA